MRRAWYTILAGLVIQAIGFFWDFLIHAQTGIKEGIEEFFKIPAHDLVVVGFVVVCVGFFLLYKELWLKRQ